MRRSINFPNKSSQKENNRREKWRLREICFCFVDFAFLRVGLCCVELGRGKKRRECGGLGGVTCACFTTSSLSFLPKSAYVANWRKKTSNPDGSYMFIHCFLFLLAHASI